MLATNSLEPLDDEQLQEAESLSQSDRPDAALFNELDNAAYEDLAARITQSDKAVAQCRELALQQGKILIFQRDRLMEQIHASTRPDQAE